MEASSSTTFPFKIEAVDPLTNTQLLRDFHGEKDGFVQVGPRKYLFPNVFTKHAEQLYNIEARPDDVWIATHPRSGTTLTQEMVWLIKNDLDYDRAASESLNKRSPFFEICGYMNEKTLAQYFHDQRDNPDAIKILTEIYAPGHEYIPKMDSPRVIKTHFPFSLMPPSVKTVQAKVIYIARNPKDVAVSYYYMSRSTRSIDYVNDFIHFWDYFERGLTTFAPYTEHLKEGWEHRNDPNVLFLFYDEMIEDLPSTIRKISQFVNKPLTEVDVAKLADHLNIENFRKNASVNKKNYSDLGIANKTEQPFIRQGKSSIKGWQQEYTPEIIERAEVWIQNFLKDTTLRFPEC